MFQRKALLLSFLLSAVGGSSATSTETTTTTVMNSTPSESFHDVADAHIHHDDLRLKVNLFRPAFTAWMKIHDKVYETLEEEVQKMVVWVQNHGTLRYVLASWK